MRYPHETPDEYVRRVVFRPYLNTAYHYGPRTLLEANALAILEGLHKHGPSSLSKLLRWHADDGTTRSDIKKAVDYLAAAELVELRQTVTGVDVWPVRL